MIAVVSVNKFTKDARVIVAMDDVFYDEAVEIVRSRNEKFVDDYCYVQRNIDFIKSGGGKWECECGSFKHSDVKIINGENKVMSVTRVCDDCKKEYTLPIPI
ncbi:hypothetical protein A0U40_09765 [[Bacillus] sp. KCTC 13219]|nr:hypothetical protein A0U40_09765 [[Bacillus] sp. KCTC 13219]